MLESGQRHRLPDWLVWNQDKSLLEGVASDAVVGNDYVIMVSFIINSPVAHSLRTPPLCEVYSVIRSYI